MKKVGVLGAGSIGVRHAENLLALGNEVHIYDPDKSRTLALKKKGAIAESKTNELLAAVDYVIIATPNEQHLADLEMAIEYGCHSLVEKPIGHSIERINGLLICAEQKNLSIYVGFNLRFRRPVVELKEQLNHHDLGKPLWAKFTCASYLPDWRPNQDYRVGYTNNRITGGVILDVIHEIDLAIYLLGDGKLVSSNAIQTGLLELESEDLAFLLLAHDSGALSSIHLDYITRPAQRHFEIGFERGHLTADLKTGTIKIVDQERNNLFAKQINFSVDEEYKEEVVAFLNLENNGPLCFANDALKSLNIALEAKKNS